MFRLAGLDAVRLLCALQKPTKRQKLRHALACQRLGLETPDSALLEVERKVPSEGLAGPMAVPRPSPVAYEDDASSQKDGSASSQDEVLACILENLSLGADPDENLLTCFPLSPEHPFSCVSCCACLRLCLTYHAPLLAGARGC